MHESFGVGLYRGPIEKSFKMGVREGVELEYKNNSTLFVSMDQLGLIHRYVGTGKKTTPFYLRFKKMAKRTQKKPKNLLKKVVYENFFRFYYKKKNTKKKF